MHARAGDRAETRLEADHAVERRRPDHRTQRLRAQGQRHDARRDRRGRTRGRAARRMRRIPGIGGRSGMAPGEFRRHRLAEDRGAEIAQAFDDPGVPLRNVIPVDPRSVGGRHVRRGDDVLDRHGNARQRARPARDIDRKIFERLEHAFHGLCLFQAGGGVLVREGLIVVEAVEKLENSGAGLRCGSCSRIGHVGRSQTKKVVRYPVERVWMSLFHRRRGFDEFLHRIKPAQARDGW